MTYPSLDPNRPRYRPDRLDIGWVFRLIPNREVDPENLPPGPDDPGTVGGGDRRLTDLAGWPRLPQAAAAAP